MDPDKYRNIPTEFRFKISSERIVSTVSLDPHGITMATKIVATTVNQISEVMNTIPLVTTTTNGTCHLSDIINQTF